MGDGDGGTGTGTVEDDGSAWRGPKSRDPLFFESEGWKVYAEKTGYEVTTRAFRANNRKGAAS